MYFDTGDKKYPILFDYWISEIYYQDEQKYLNKTDIFLESLKYVHSQGLHFENIIFDNGFFNNEIIDCLESLGITYISRCSKNKRIELNNQSVRADEAFVDDYNGSFYYYHKYGQFLKTKVAGIYSSIVNIVAIAQGKDKLLENNYIYLVSNNLDLLHTQIVRLYKSRWGIENFFKILKSYLSLSVFYRNNYDYVNERINLALSAFIVLQEVSCKLKKTLFRTLKLFQNGKLEYLFKETIENCSKYIYNYVSENNTCKTYKLSEFQKI